MRAEQPLPRLLVYAWFFFAAVSIVSGLGWIVLDIARTSNPVLLDRPRINIVLEHSVGPMQIIVGLFQMLLWRRWRAARAKAMKTRCPKCEYDRRGLTPDAKCPECGTAPASTSLAS